MGRPKGSKNKQGSMFDSIDSILLNTTAVGECFNWKGTLDRNGYPKSKYKGKNIVVSRWVVCLSESVPYDDPRQTRHLCTNPSCVNPRHLALGTALENNHDRDYTVDEELWEDIAGLVKLGMSQRQIGSLYGLSHVTIGKGLKRHVGSN